MKAVTRETLKSRIDAIVASMYAQKEDGSKYASDVAGASQSTISVLTLIYAASSAQLKYFLSRIAKGPGKYDDIDIHYKSRVAREIESILTQALADFDSGITANERVQAKGEVLGDFVALARASLSSGAEGAVRVAAVLTAAALEETLKQLGESADLDVYDRDMRGVVQKLKDSNVLVGAQVGLAGGLVKFRDNAFHGQFELVERATIESALAFVEGLLNTRFS